MKGFKSTGNGPKSGFSFPPKFGFGDSSGKTKTVNSYARRSPKRMKKAIGGLAEGKAPHEGWTDFNEGGRVTKGEAKKIAHKAIGEHVARPAPKGHKGFERIPLIRK